MINATFNNISAISLSSVLLVEEIEIFGENHRPVAIHQETLLHNVLAEIVWYLDLHLAMEYVPITTNSWGGILDKTLCNKVSW
jgi:hypothetical protein